MIIDWAASFDSYLDRLERKTANGDQHSQVVLDYVLAALAVLQDLESEPEDESATIKRVRQSGRHPVWRIAHPFHPEVAVRLIVWFPPDQPSNVVVVLFAGTRSRSATCSTTASVPEPTPRSSSGSSSNANSEQQHKPRVRKQKTHKPRKRILTGSAK